MHATITQRQEPGGALGQRQEYYLDCTVQLNDDERQRIKASSETLLDHVIASGHEMSYAEFRWSPRSYSRGAPFLLVLLLVVGIWMLPLPIMDNLGTLFLWLSLIGYCVFNFFNGHEGFASSDVIRVSTILDKPSFSIYAKNKAEADFIAEDVRMHLSELDALLGAQQTT